MIQSAFGLLPRACLAVIASVLAVFSVTARAQTAPIPAAPAPAPRAENSTPVELSLFEVRAEDDSGYQAGNTTSGSRLNSRLKDTPAAVSAFTPEFLADIAATNLEEMLAHATNIEIDVEADAPVEASAVVGSPTRIRIVSEEEREFHLRSYDIELTGDDVVFEFVADKLGVFELEDHDTGDLILTFEVLAD